MKEYPRKWYFHPVILSIIGFLFSILIIWLDEIVDIPYLLLNAPRTPFNLVEALIETLVVALVGAMIIWLIFYGHKRRKQVEEDLRESEFRNRLLFEKTKLPIMIIDENDKCIECNDAVKEFSKTGCHGIVDKLLGTHVLLDKSEKKKECRFDLDGMERTVQLMITPSRWKGHDVHFLIINDITEKIKAAEILKRDKKMLQKLVDEQMEKMIQMQNDLHQAKRLSEIGTLSAIVAHELRSPLAVINIATEAIKRKIRGKEDINLDQQINALEEKIKQGNLIINNLLTYSKVKMPQYEKVELYKILKDCIMTFEKKQGNKVSFDQNIASIKEIFVELDPLQITEVFHNIINNAVDAVDRSTGRVKIDAQRHGRTVAILVKDNGCGISQENIKKIMDPFFTTKSQGTGLGLAVTRQIIDLHGGTIDIQSQEQKGTLVEVTLPLERAASDKKEEVL